MREMGIPTARPARAVASRVKPVTRRTATAKVAPTVPPKSVRHVKKPTSRNARPKMVVPPLPRPMRADQRAKNTVVTRTAPATTKTTPKAATKKKVFSAFPRPKPKADGQ